VNVKSWFRRNFTAGVIVVVPLLGTIALFWWLVGKITDPGFAWLQTRFTQREYKQFLEDSELPIRLVVLFLMFGLTVVIGALARNFLGRQVLRIGETIVERIPIVNRVYIAFRQISHAFWGQNKTVFSHVVLLEYPRKGLYTLGFVTSAGKGEVKAKTDERLLNVFLPTTPNPTSGWFVMVPEDHAIRLDMKVEDALKMIISGGAVVPEYRKAVSVLEARHKGEGETAQQHELPAPHSG
jgi:uncharacterized membrane protein